MIFLILILLAAEGYIIAIVMMVEAWRALIVGLISGDNF